jgi:hypothetical protein
LNLPLAVIVPVVLVLCPFLARKSGPLLENAPPDVIGMNRCSTHVLPWQLTFNAWIEFVACTPTMIPSTPFSQTPFLTGVPAEATTTKSSDTAVETTTELTPAPRHRQTSSPSAVCYFRAQSYWSIP